MKQETLEEAAKKYANKIWDYSDSNEKTLHANCNKAFLKGAKYQAERMYSEEDMIDFLDWSKSTNQKKSEYELSCLLKKEHIDSKVIFTIWFEQFKKEIR